MKRILVTILLIGAGALPLRADVKGSKDHPAIKRYEGSTIIGYERADYESLMIPVSRVGEVGGRNAFVKPLNPEGGVTRIRYKAPAGRSSLEVFRNYEAALKAAGFQTLFSCSKTACGDADIFAQTLYGIGAQPLTLNQKSQNFLAAKLPRSSGDVYIRLFAIENNSWAGEAGTQEGQVVVQLDVVETKPMEGGMVTVDSSAMKTAIRESGRVALYGIYFDSGKAEIKPDSKPSLGEIAELLASENSMRLLVVGHTDTDGNFAANRELSERRAAAVVKALVSTYGIASSRLTPVGIGFSSPVATNRTADGKAKNRRVELVEY
jgi:OOP family OmpA-OmpF porin